MSVSGMPCLRALGAMSQVSLRNRVIASCLAYVLDDAHARPTSQ